MLKYTTKRVSEKIMLGFAFAKRMGGSVAVPETITSAVFTLELVQGTDPAFETMIEGDAQIDGTEIRSWIIGGVDGCVYHLTCRATTNFGRILVATAEFQVAS